MLRKRPEFILEAAQCEDQAGFRHGRTVDEHLLTFNLLQERCKEWGQQLWVAAVDFTKAFDSIKQDYLWQALLDQKVPECYVHLLQKLYHDQTARIKLDCQSEMFSITKVTKQGDPLSPMLFNALLEQMFGPIKEK